MSFEHFHVFPIERFANQANQAQFGEISFSS